MASLHQYNPVACELVDLIEILATQKKKIDIFYRLDEKKQKTQGIIKTWYTKEKEEFLEMNNGVVIRLDQLISINGDDVTAISNCEL